MSRAETLRMGRLARARETMSSTCRVERHGERVWNRDTATYERGDVTVVYAGACEVSYVNAARMTDLGEGERAVGTYRVALPWNNPASHLVSVSDVVVVVNGADPRTTGRTFYVDSVPMDENDTARYLNVTSQEDG